MRAEDIDKNLQQLTENGEHVSPILPAGIKNYLIDIDGTICDDIPNEEPERMVTAELYPDALETLNRWYDEGHIIFFFTSRTEAHRQVTEEWLNKHGFKYHGMLMGKPRGGNYHWIDNHLVKATRYRGKFTELIDKEVTIQVFDDGNHDQD
nr:phosphoheptose isomerase [uncultured Flavobacterium sp.]